MFKTEYVGKLFYGIHGVVVLIKNNCVTRIIGGAGRSGVTHKIELGEDRMNDVGVNNSTMRNTKQIIFVAFRWKLKVVCY